MLAGFYQFFFVLQNQVYAFYHCPFTKDIHSTFQETRRRKYLINKLVLDHNTSLTYWKSTVRHSTQFCCASTFFFQLNWDLNIGYILKPHLEESNNAVWRNMKLCKFQEKERQVLLLKSHYGKIPLIDYFQ